MASTHAWQLLINEVRAAGAASLDERSRPKSARSHFSRRAVAGSIFAVLALLTVSGLYATFNMEASSRIADIKSDEVWRAEVGANRQASETRDLTMDLRYLVASSGFTRWLSSGSAVERAELEGDFRAMADTNPAYDQIRFLDASGRERIRVDRVGGALVAAQGDQLQDKSDRYYFTESLKLKPGQIYISPLDLNVEHSAIERPIKPTLRLGMPVVDANGAKQGVVILNYNARGLLARLRQLARAGTGVPWLVNKAGYWLIGPADAEWAFMFPERPQQTFSKDHPAVWRELTSGRASGQVMANGDMFTYAKVSFPSDVGSFEAALGKGQGDAPWVRAYITFVSAAKLAEVRWEVARPFLVIGAILLPLFGFAAVAGTDQYMRRREAEFQKDEAEIRERGEKLATLIIESSPVAFVLIDHNGQIVRVNAAAETLFGYSRDEVVGQAAEILMPERLRDRNITMRDYFLIPERFGTKTGHGSELVGRRKDGNEFYMEVGLGEMQLGGKDHTLASVNDVSARYALELEKEKAREEIRNLNSSLEQRVAERTAELESSNRELEAFCYSVSHDLRSPLRAIDGFSLILEQDYGPQIDESGKDSVTRIRRAAQRMGGLIDDLLNLSRISRYDLDRAEVDLSTKASNTLEELKALTPERHAEIVIADGIKAYGDSRLLRIVIDNLVGNAWKFTRDRAPARIEFGRTEMEGGTAYYVRDNGVGFDMQYAGRLFGAFQRLHQKHEFPGHGIGLAMVQRVIIKHGGRIWAQSEPDKGATFYFTL